MASPRFIIVGAGRLGAYHLQGLAKIDQDAVIDVFDPSPASLKNARVLFDEIENSSRHKIRYLNNCDDLKDDYFLGINATTSGFRLDSVYKTGYRAENWILEKILTQNVEQIDLIEMNFGHGQQAWVNLMLRELSWLKDGQKEILKQNMTTFETDGRDWSLACNVPHHLDLVGWLSGGQLQKIDTSGLCHEWRESKRKGYFDLLGTIKAQYDNAVEALFISRAEGAERVSTIKTEQDVWTLDEIQATLSSQKGYSFEGEFDRQSSLTTRLTNTLLAGAELNLPSLSYAAKTHRIYIKAMLQHWNLTMNKKDKAIPIT